MSWIKRNLGFVISGVLGLVLLGLSGWYLYSQMQADQAAKEAFESALKNLQDYQTANPYPSEANLRLAQQDYDKASRMSTNARSMFPAFQRYSNLNERDFKNYIENQVDLLQRNAKKFGVRLPPDYYFTFGSLKKMMEFPADLIPVWIEQMEEIKTLVSILIKARVYAINDGGIRRIPISENEGVDYYMDFMSGLESVTNRSVIRTPYDVTFTCFSGELAAVLEGFMRSSNCFLLKNIQVAPSDEEVVQFAEPTEETQAIPTTPVPGASQVVDPATQRRLADEAFRRRYGVSRTGKPESPVYTPPPPPVAITPPPPKVIPRPKTVLTEKPLRITVFLEILKLEAPPLPSPGKGPKSPPRRTP